MMDRIAFDEHFKQREIILQSCLDHLLAAGVLDFHESDLFSLILLHMSEVLRTKMISQKYFILSNSVIHFFHLAIFLSSF